jgi:hypothetical protein
MDKLSPIQKLDEVLKILSVDILILPDITKKLVAQNIIIEEKELKSILQKLRKDGYIYFIPDEPFDLEVHDHLNFQASFEGQILNQSNGYQGRHQSEEDRNTQMARLEQNQKDYQNNMIWLTAILSVGTLIAAAYYFLEVYDNHRCFSYWLCGAIIGLLLTAIVYLKLRKRNK